ncbi:MAG TPA: DUF488 domain-containing protein [Acidimicrobiales bacterium]
MASEADHDDPGGDASAGGAVDAGADASAGGAVDAGPDASTGGAVDAGAATRYRRAGRDEDAAPVRLLTLGHGTLEADGFASLLVASGVEVLVDVRSYPGSRRHPHFGRAAMEEWVPRSGVRYRWEPRLGGRRRTRPDSPHVALRNPAFRGYADHMGTEEFRAGLEDVLAEAARARVAVMCAESLWWRCHRRLIADAAVLLAHAEVEHLMHEGAPVPHPVTPGARRSGDRVVYDAGGAVSLPL